MGTAAAPSVSPLPASGGADQQPARLLEALRAVGSELELPVVLRHIVEAAVTLVRAGYGGVSRAR